MTGLISHYAQNVSQPIPFPTSPSWGYRVTQGLHVITGTAAVPLLLVKLWTVYPRLFIRPPRGARKLLLEVLERGSIAVLVAGAIFQLASGLANSAQWYPWAFSFRTTHYAIAWITIGALVVHIAVKLPIIRGALTSDVEDTTYDRPTATEPGPLSRRGLLRTTWVAAGVAVLATAGSTVPLLRKVSVFGVRSGDGPAGIPINKSAAAAKVAPAATSAGYRFTVAYGDREVSMTRDELLAMEQTSRDPADRVRRGLERERHLDRRPGARPARPGRRAAPAATCWWCRCRSPGRTGGPSCRGTSPTTTGPCWRWRWRASRWRSTTATRRG